MEKEYLPNTVDLKALKTGGLIKHSEKDLFAIRLRTPAGKFDANGLDIVSQVAKKYGSGRIHLTVRQGIEIQDIPFSSLQAAKDELEANGVRIGACGPRFRVITACPGGGVCPNGIIPTQKLALQLDETFYGKEAGLNLPHKFKVGITGCLSACAKPQENDFGIQGQVEPELFEDECNGCGICEVTCKETAISMNEDDIPVRNPDKCIFCGDCIKNCPTEAWQPKRSGMAIYVGGHWGRHPELGEKIADFVPEDKLIDLIAKTLEFYKKEGKKGERFGMTLKRVGVDNYKEAVLNGISS
jgi:dissimilatory sulfite reductase (desulfoviridin) alpha/beta subunit